MHVSVRTRLVALALATLAAVLAAAPAEAIVYGRPDGTAHPNVGALVVETPDGARFALCSGTLIAEATYLTAAHCVAALEEFDLTLVGVSFDPVFDPATSTIVPAAEAVANPAYDGTPYTDVAVILLAADAGDYYPDIEPAALPTVGLLETLRPSAQRGKPNRGLTIVGYGLSAYERGAVRPGRCTPTSGCAARPGSWAWARG